MEKLVIRRELKEKVGKELQTTFTQTDEKEVYRFLASELIAKKINQCSYIKSIQRKQMYTHLEIIVNYDNGDRSVYYLPALF